MAESKDESDESLEALFERLTRFDGLSSCKAFRSGPMMSEICLVER